MSVHAARPTPTGGGQLATPDPGPSLVRSAGWRAHRAPLFTPEHSQRSWSTFHSGTLDSPS